MYDFRIVVNKSKPGRDGCPFDPYAEHEPILAVGTRAAHENQRIRSELLLANSAV
jgi:hypothetical protein